MHRAQNVITLHHKAPEVASLEADHMDPRNGWSELRRTCWAGTRPRRQGLPSRPVLLTVIEPTPRGSSRASTQAAKLAIKSHSLPTKTLHRVRRGDLVAA